MSYTSSDEQSSQSLEVAGLGSVSDSGCRGVGGKRIGRSQHLYLNGVCTPATSPVAGISRLTALGNFQGLSSTAGDLNQYLGTWLGHLCFEALCVMQYTIGVKNQGPMTEMALLKPVRHQNRSRAL